MLWMLATRKRDMDAAREEGREEARQQIVRALLARGIEIPPDLLRGAGKDEQA